MKPRRLFPTSLAASIVAVAFLVGSGPLDAQRQNTNAVAKPDARTVLHVLNRLGFGARPGDIERVQQMGIDSYIALQLNPERVSDDALNERLAAFETVTLSSRELTDKYFVPAQMARRDQQLKQQKAEAKAQKSDPTMSADPSMTAAAGEDAPGTEPALPVSPDVLAARQGEQVVLNELMQARVLRAAMSERQLDEVLTDFWMNHFNVFIGKGQVRQYLPEYERDVIRPRVLGNFRDLLGAVAHSPAMLFYLDNWQSAGPDAVPAVPPQVLQRLNNPRLSPAQRAQLQARLQQMRRPPNAQNPAAQRQKRGLNENYGRELMELHTLGVDGGYTQKDVIDVARALTGWTIDRPQQGGSFVFQPRMHDTGEKLILGVHFPAGRGEDEGERVLDILAKHPSTAHHIAYQLAQRFVADEPPPALVDRAAKTFLSTNGNLREVVRVIVTSPEFFAPESYRSKVKSPLEFVISAVRASGANVVNAMPIVQALRTTLGMPLYGCQPPTGYSNTSDTWVNTGALLNRMNFAVQLVSGGQMRPLPGGRNGGPGQAGPPPQAAQQAARQAARQALPFAEMRPGQLARAPLQVDIKSLAPDTSEASRDHLLASMLAGDVSDDTRQVLVSAETPQHLVALTLGSPEFQRR
jgi:uncharacterized protein (DUF1800 family)